MTEFEDMYNNEFFIIDSNNLDIVENAFYGFTFINNEICFNLSQEDVKDLDGSGVYIYINKNDNEISIFQDFNGSYGLYLYKHEDTFVLSNSFLYLVEYLKYNYPISLNKDYCNQYISSEFCSIGYKQTLINEVELIPHDYIINLDINKKEIKYTKIDYQEKSVKINTKEGLEILDSWFYKWVNIFNNLYEKNNKIQLELSGGFDTRMVLALALNSSINLNKIKVETYTPYNKVFLEDYNIASKLANKFNFKLNENEPNLEKTYFKDLETTLNVSFYPRIGSSKQMIWREFKFNEKLYNIRGFGGEIVRNIYKNASVESFMLFQKNKALSYSTELGKSTERVLKNNFKEFKKITGNNSVRDLLAMQYRCTRNRYHYGKFILESYLVNDINLTPLIDPLINKIHFNLEESGYDYLLSTLIYIRYCPDLIDVEFEGGRKISEEIIECAKKINDIKPFNNKYLKKENTYTHTPSSKNTPPSNNNSKNSNLNNHNTKNNYPNNLNSKNTPSKNISTNIQKEYDEIVEIEQTEVMKYLNNIFFSENFEKIFSEHYSEKLYKTISKKEEKITLNDPLSDIVSIIGSMKVIEDIHFNQTKNLKTMAQWLNSLDSFELNNNLDKQNTSNNNNNTLELESLEKYNTARIDLKNIGLEDNNLFILDNSDERIRIFKPGWYKDSKGHGLQIESSENKLDLTVRCKNDGVLHINLKSKYVLDSNGKILPIYIKYKKLSVNSLIIFEEDKVASLEDTKTFKFNVKDNQILKIHLEWEAY